MLAISYSKYPSLFKDHQDKFPVFAPRSFTVVAFNFRLGIELELIFLYGSRWGIKVCFFLYEASFPTLFVCKNDLFSLYCFGAFINLKIRVGAGVFLDSCPFQYSVFYANTTILIPGFLE